MAATVPPGCSPAPEPCSPEPWQSTKDPPPSGGPPGSSPAVIVTPEPKPQPPGQTTADKTAATAAHSFRRIRRAYRKNTPGVKTSSRAVPPRLELLPAPSRPTQMPSPQSW